MAQVISMQDIKDKKASAKYTAYFGTPITVQYVKRPSLTLVTPRPTVDLSAYLESLEGEDIDVSSIIQLDPNIPW